MPDLQKPSGASVDFQGKSESNHDFWNMAQLKWWIYPLKMVDLSIVIWLVVQ